MIAYRPHVRMPAYQPSAPSAQAPVLAGPQLGQVWNSIGPAPSLVGAAIGAGSAWVGWTVGKEKKGFLSVTGYVVAVFGVLGALAGTFNFLRGLSR